MALLNDTKLDWLFLFNRIVDIGFFMDLILGFFMAYQDKTVMSIQANLVLLSNAAIDCYCGYWTIVLA